jgi:hypothetical protein
MCAVQVNLRRADRRTDFDERQPAVAIDDFDPAGNFPAAQLFENQIGFHGFLSLMALAGRTDLYRPSSNLLKVNIDMTTRIHQHECIRNATFSNHAACLQLHPV